MKIEDCFVGFFEAYLAMTIKVFVTTHLTIPHSLLTHSLIA
jgi:hypothetical protein